MTQPQFYKGVIDASGCISNAWELIKPNYWLFFLISLLTYVMIACIPCINVFVTGPVLGGVYYTALRAMRGEPIEFGMMFKGFEKFVPLMVVGLIQSVPAIIYQILDITIRISGAGLDAITGPQRGRSGSTDLLLQVNQTDLLAGSFLIIVIVVSVVMMIFWVAWSITFTFAVPIAMEHDISPLDAIKLSARASWGNVGGIIVLAIFCGLVALLGVIALCIGVFFVMPVIWVAWAFAYRQVFPDLMPSVYRNEPPPPDAYQGSFGQGM